MTRRILAGMVGLTMATAVYTSAAGMTPPRKNAVLAHTVQLRAEQHHREDDDNGAAGAADLTEFALMVRAEAGADPAVDQAAAGWRNTFAGYGLDLADSNVSGAVLLTSRMILADLIGRAANETLDLDDVLDVVTKAGAVGALQHVREESYATVPLLA